MQWTSSSSSNQLALLSLSHLTKLQQLDLGTIAQTTDDISDAVFPAMAPLVQLSKLTLSIDVQVLRLMEYLPQQLQDLELFLMQDKSDATGSAVPNALALQLGNLTLLTRLSLNKCPVTGGSCRRGIRQIDVLPESLRVLEVPDCGTLQPILHLHHLQRLSMDHSTTPAHELQKLTQLTALTHVSLSYAENSGQSTYMAAPAAAAAWSALTSLKELDFSFLRDNSYDWAVLKSAEIHGIGRAKTLQDLSISGKVFTAEAAAALPAALRQLTALTRLRLDYSLEGHHDADTLEERITRSSWNATLQVTEALACSIASLPILRDVCLDDMCIPEGPETLALSRATQLTSLSASYCFLTDQQVTCMLADMNALQDLRLSGNERVTVASAPTIARLTQLTSLGLLYTSVFVPATRDNLQCLTSLQRWQYCDLPGDLECWWIGQQTSA